MSDGFDYATAWHTLIGYLSGCDLDQDQLAKAYAFAIARGAGLRS